MTNYIDRPTFPRYLADMVLLVASRGTCSRLQVGALLVRDTRVIVTAYNGAPAGHPHCQHIDDEPCEVSVHAEANAFAFAARYGIATEGAYLVTTHAPCLNCAKLAINAGLAGVYWMEDYRDASGVGLIRRANLERVPTSSGAWIDPEPARE